MCEPQEGPMSGEILHIHIAPRDGAPMEARDEVVLDVERGVLGDRYEGTAKQAQVTIVCRQELDQAAEELGREIPPGATRRNITIDGFTLEEKVGQELALGDAVVRITRTAPPCENMNTSIAPGARQALQERAGVRATVVKGGTVRKGDPVRVRS